MATLIDPHHDVPVTDAIEAECGHIMARRAALKRAPGTHGEQADMVAELDGLLDQWNEATRCG